MYPKWNLDFSPYDYARLRHLELTQGADVAYRLWMSEPVLEGVQRIALEQIDKALHEIQSDEIDRHKAVHQVRKRCKKIRGLVRLVRPAFEDIYQIENATYRDASRRLSALRDTEAMIETFDDLMDVFGDVVDRERLASVREELERRRVFVAEHEFDLDARLEEFEQTIREARDRVESWDLDDDGWDAIAGGLRKTYQRGRVRMADAYEHPSTEAFHEWRKRVKYHWYHMRLLRDIWADEMNPRRKAAKDIADLLGDEHDLAVLREAVLEAPPAFGDSRVVQTLVALIDRRRVELREAAEPLGMRLYAERPGAHVRRLGGYWKAAQHEEHASGAYRVPDRPAPVA